MLLSPTGHFSAAGPQTLHRGWHCREPHACLARRPHLRLLRRAHRLLLPHHTTARRLPAAFTAVVPGITRLLFFTKRARALAFLPDGGACLCFAHYGRHALPPLTQPTAAHTLTCRACLQHSYRTTSHHLLPLPCLCHCLLPWVHVARGSGYGSTFSGGAGNDGRLLAPYRTTPHFRSSCPFAYCGNLPRYARRCVTDLP